MKSNFIFSSLGSSYLFFREAKEPILLTGRWTFLFLYSSSYLWWGSYYRTELMAKFKWVRGSVICFLGNLSGKTSLKVFLKLTAALGGVINFFSIIIIMNAIFNHQGSMISKIKLFVIFHVQKLFLECYFIMSKNHWSKSFWFFFIISAKIPLITL